MKKYSIFCNMCGKEIKMKDGWAEEGVLSVEKAWDYFSQKDGELHSFELCGNCYDQIAARFKIPVTVKRQTELL